MIEITVCSVSFKIKINLILIKLILFICFKDYYTSSLVKNDVYNKSFAYLAQNNIYSKLTMHSFPFSVLFLSIFFECSVEKSDLY